MNPFPSVWPEFSNSSGLPVRPWECAARGGHSETSNAIALKVSTFIKCLKLVCQIDHIGIKEFAKQQLKIAATMDGRWKGQQNVRHDAESLANNKPRESRGRAPMNRMCRPEPIQKTNLIPVRQRECAASAATTVPSCWNSC